jgi:hypothetical protein
VALGRKKIEEGFADVCNGKLGSGHGSNGIRVREKTGQKNSGETLLQKLKFDTREFFEILVQTVKPCTMFYGQRGRMRVVGELACGACMTAPKIELIQADFNTCPHF